MKPLCEKDYVLKIIHIIGTAIGLFFYTLFLINMDDPLMWLIMIPFTVLLAYYVSDIVYWIFQPKVLIYQYDEGIIIKRKIRIEYKSIQRVDCKSYVIGSHRHLKSTPYAGTIIIQLKSGKIHKIRNAFYPLGTVDVLCRIKQQKRFK